MIPHPRMTWQCQGHQRIHIALDKPMPLPSLHTVHPMHQTHTHTYLLALEVEACEPAQVLAAHRLVDCCTAPDALAVVVRHLRPPVSLLLHVAQDHVLNGSGQARHLPGDVGLCWCARIGGWVGAIVGERSAMHVAYDDLSRNAGQLA